MRLRRRAVAAALVGLVAAGAALASASTLTVASDSVYAGLLDHPCAGTATAQPVASTDWFNPGYAGLAITLPPGCGNVPVDVTLASGAGVVSSGLGMVDGSGTVTTSPVFTDPDLTVHATVEGWDLPVDYSWTPPASCTVVSGSGTCDAEVTLWTGQRPGGSSSALYFEVWVTTTSSQWVTWEVTFHLDNVYYPVTVTRLGNSDLDSYTDADGRTWSQDQQRRINDVHRVGACSRDLTVQGDSTSRQDRDNFEVVRAATPRFFALVVNRTEAGYFDVLDPSC